MKYYKKELWKSNNDEDEKKWLENSKKYSLYFDSIEKYLPKKFLKVYFSEGGFHDYIIDSISIDTPLKKNNLSHVSIVLKNGQTDFMIELLDVSTFRIDVVDKNNCICGKLSWGYAEFERIDTKKMKLSILCDIENEIEFVFEKIRVVDKGDV